MVQKVTYTSIIRTSIIRTSIIRAFDNLNLFNAGQLINKLIDKKIVDEWIHDLVHRREDLQPKMGEDESIGWKVIDTYSPRWGEWLKEHPHRPFELFQKVRGRNPSMLRGEGLSMIVGYVEPVASRVVNIEGIMSFASLLFKVEWEITIKLNAVSRKYSDAPIAPLEKVKRFHWANSIEIPFEIFKCWICGEIEGENVSVLRMDAHSISYDDGYFLPYSLYKLVISLGNDPLGQLLAAGCMNADTYKLVNNRINRGATRVEAVQTKEKDRQRLKSIADTKGQPLSYSQWAKLLGLRSKGSTHGILQQFESEAFVVIIKNESGGVSISLTEKGKGVLGAF